MQKIMHIEDIYSFLLIDNVADLYLKKLLRGRKKLRFAAYFAIKMKDTFIEPSNFCKTLSIAYQG